MSEGGPPGDVAVQGWVDAGLREEFPGLALMQLTADVERLIRESGRRAEEAR